MRHTDTLTKNYEFRRIYQKGKSAVTPFLVLYARPWGGPGKRIGFTVSGKIGGAVVRNRVRRRLKEAYRLQEERFRPGVELVVVARGRAKTAPFGELERAMRTAAGKLGLLREQES